MTTGSATIFKQGGHLHVFRSQQHGPPKCPADTGHFDDYFFVSLTRAKGWSFPPSSPSMSHCQVPVPLL